jgi:hypothetical protein
MSPRARTALEGTWYQNLRHRGDWPRVTAEPEVTGSAVCIQLKPVSNARFGDQVAGVGRIRLQLAAQVGQVHPQVIRFGLVGRPLHLLEELLLCDQPVDVAYQDFQ